VSALQHHLRVSSLVLPQPLQRSRASPSAVRPATCRLSALTPGRTRSLPLHSLHLVRPLRAFCAALCIRYVATAPRFVLAPHTPSPPVTRSVRSVRPHRAPYVVSIPHAPSRRPHAPSLVASLTPYALTAPMHSRWPPCALTGPHKPSLLSMRSHCFPCAPHTNLTSLARPPCHLHAIRPFTRSHRPSRALTNPPCVLTAPHAPLIRPSCSIAPYMRHLRLSRVVSAPHTLSPLLAPPRASSYVPHALSPSYALVLGTQVGLHEPFAHPNPCTN
jgi:hypothetical protein